MRCPTSFFLRLLLRLKSRPHLAGLAVGDWSCRLPACLLEGGGETQHLVTRHSVNPTPRRACGYQECQTYCACAVCFPWTSGSQATAMSRSLVPRPTSVSLCFRSFSMSPSLTVPAGSVKGWVVGGLSETYLMLSYFLLSAFWLPSDWPSTFA